MLLGVYEGRAGSLIRAPERGCANNWNRDGGGGAWAGAARYLRARRRCAGAQVPARLGEGGWGVCVISASIRPPLAGDENRAKLSLSGSGGASRHGNLYSHPTSESEPNNAPPLNLEGAGRVHPFNCRSLPPDSAVPLLVSSPDGTVAALVFCPPLYVHIRKGRPDVTQVDLVPAPPPFLPSRSLRPTTQTQTTTTTTTAPATAPA